METSYFWIFAVLASIAIGLGKGGLPMVGMLGVPILSLVINPLMAASLLLPVYVISDVFGVYTYRRKFDARVLAIIVPGMLTGVLIAWATIRIIPEPVVTALVGAIGVTFALHFLLRTKKETPPKKAEIAPGLFWGSLAGFTSFMVHSGSPPYQVYTLPLKLPKMVFAGTTAISFAICNLAKLVPYYMLGQLNIQNLEYALILALPASIAVFGGMRLVRQIPEQIFYRAVTWVLLLISAKLLWDGLRATLS